MEYRLTAAYKYIVNPITKEKYDVASTEGRQLLKLLVQNYMQSGGLDLRPNAPTVITTYKIEDDNTLRFQSSTTPSDDGQSSTTPSDDGQSSTTPSDDGTKIQERFSSTFTLEELELAWKSKSPFTKPSDRVFLRGEGFGLTDARGIVVWDAEGTAVGGFQLLKPINTTNTGKKINIGDTSLLSGIPEYEENKTILERCNS